MNNTTIDFNNLYNKGDFIEEIDVGDFYSQYCEGINTNIKEFGINAIVGYFIIRVLTSLFYKHGHKIFLKDSKYYNLVADKDWRFKVAYNINEFANMIMVGYVVAIVYLYWFI